MTEKQVVGKLDMNEVEPHILAILEHLVDTYNLIYQTRGISDELPLRIGHITDGKFTDMDTRQHIYHAMPKYDIGMLMHILSIYTESDIIGEDEVIEDQMKSFQEQPKDEWVLDDDIGIDKDVEEE